MEHRSTPLYVCVCNGYSDRDIRDVARTGVSCARAAYQSLGAGPRCGKCLEFAQALIDEQQCGRGSEPALALQLQTVE